MEEAWPPFSGSRLLFFLPLGPPPAKHPEAKRPADKKAARRDQSPWRVCASQKPKGDRPRHVRKKVARRDQSPLGTRVRLQCKATMAAVGSCSFGIDVDIQRSADGSSAGAADSPSTATGAPIAVDEPTAVNERNVAGNPAAAGGIGGVGGASELAALGMRVQSAFSTVLRNTRPNASGPWLKVMMMAHPSARGVVRWAANAMPDAMVAEMRGAQAEVRSVCRELMRLERRRAAVAAAATAVDEHAGERGRAEGGGGGGDGDGTPKAPHSKGPAGVAAGSFLRHLMKFTEPGAEPRLSETEVWGGGSRAAVVQDRGVGKAELWLCESRGVGKAELRLCEAKVCVCVWGGGGAAATRDSGVGVQSCGFARGYKHGRCLWGYECVGMSVHGNVCACVRACALCWGMHAHGAEWVGSFASSPASIGGVACIESIASIKFMARQWNTVVGMAHGARLSSTLCRAALHRPHGTHALACNLPRASDVMILHWRDETPALASRDSCTGVMKLLHWLHETPALAR
eukprot:364210-Chlamydomonas_euryale.AAC.4